VRSVYERLVEADRLIRIKRIRSDLEVQMARGSNGVSAVSRVLGVLDAFSIDAPFLTLTEIAHRAGIPVSSAHGIVVELVEHGLLERMPDRSYRVGVRLWEMGSRTPGVLGLREIAFPHLQAVQAVVRQHTQLAVRSDLDVLIIERLSARDAVVNGSMVGGRIPLQHSSSGLVLLAAADDDLVPRILQRGLDPQTEEGLHTERDLREAIIRTRRLGHALTEGYLYGGTRGIAVPIRGSQNVVVGALGVVVANDGNSPADYVLLLRRAAASISEALLRSYLPPEHPGARPGGVYRHLVNSSDRSMQYLEHHDVV
jgi:DNA-binding IclR family transcriptional regulator